MVKVLKKRNMMYTVSVAALDYVNRELQGFRHLKYESDAGFTAVPLVSQGHIEQCICHPCSGQRVVRRDLPTKVMFLLASRISYLP